MTYHRVLSVLLAVMLLSWACASQAAPTVYDIRSDEAALGISSVDWTPLGDPRISTATTELPNALVQSDRLWLDASGWPMRYRLHANVQGRPTRVEVRREKNSLIETVDQDGHQHTRRYPLAAPVDFVDNNSLDGFQALLDRLHGKPTPGSQLQVFVPQAQDFGTLHFDKVSDTQETIDAASVKVRSISARLSVAGKTVPLTLWLNPVDGHLLRFAQTRQNVTMTARVAAPDASPTLAQQLAQQGRCLNARRLHIHSGDADLVAELTVPNQSAEANLKPPVVLLIPDDGNIDLDGNVPATSSSSAAYKQLAYALACHGVATLRYDKPGVSPPAKAAPVTAQSRAADVASLLNALLRQPDIDPQRMVLAGHANGGLIALYALHGLKPQPAALVLLETPGKALDQVLTQRLLTPAQVLGASAATLKALKHSADETLSAIRASDGQHLTLNGSLAENPLARSLAASAGLIRSELPLAPQKLAADVKIPMLIVQGGKDLQVLPDNAAALQKADPDARRLDFADMTYALLSSPLPPLSAQTLAPGSLIEPALAQGIADWVLQQTRGSRLRTDSRSAGE